MAGPNQVNINLNVQSNLKDANKDASQLNSTLKQAAQTAGGINVPRGTAGSRAVAAGAQPVGAQAVMQYGQLRGAAGATGASARDFANQAQGLGGLVRLYATYAANIFAVSAAFNALSNAMDTTNMVKGLDQLGASGGKALGALSKRLVAATGGAISLREAMTATAQASAAGMSGENILRLGKAATQASQALGVSLPDAVSRLSRGITKLEPELLDELGIFVKIEEVTTKYATSVGKTASSLTDFERRQAFANAVLDQAEKKFSAIEIDTNPYTKLAAAAKDTAQRVLELVNVGLVPLVNLLSSSPTALLAVFGAIGVKLTKDAIPALGDYKAALAQTAEASRGSASKRFQDLKSSLNSEIQLKIKAADDAAEAESERVEAASKRIAAVRAVGAGKSIDKRAFAISQKEYGQAGIASGKGVTEADLKYLDQLAAKGTKIAPIYKEMADSYRGYTAAETAMTAAQNLGNIQLTKRANILTGAGQVELRYHGEVNKARSASLVNEAAQIGSTQGLGAAFKAAVANFTAAGKSTTTSIDILDAANQKTGKTLAVTTAGMNVFSRSMVFAKSAAVGLVAGIGTAVAAFAPWLEILGLIVAAGALFINWMSTTQEESEATSKSLTAVKDSTKNLVDTLDVINKKPLLDQFNPQSIAAKATALNTLGDSLRKVFEDARKEISAMSLTDKAVDIVKMIWGGDTNSKLVAATSKGLADAFKAIDQNSEPGKAASASVKNILKVDNLKSTDQITAALKKMGSAESMSAIQELTALIQNFGKESAVSAAKITELVDSFVKVTETRRKVQTEFVPKDTFSEYGKNILDTFYKVDRALQDPEQKLAAIIALSKELGSLPVPRELVNSLEGIAKQAEDLQYVTAELSLIDNEITKLKELTAGKSVVIGVKTKQLEGKSIREITEDIKNLEQRKASLGDIKVNITTSITSEQKKIDAATIAVYQAGSDIISSKVAAEWTKAGATVSNAIASLLNGTQTGIKMRADAERAVINSQIAQIKSQQALILAVEENTIVTERATLKSEIGRFSELGVVPAGSDTRLKQLDQRQAQIDKYRGSATTSIGGKDIAGNITVISKEAKAFEESMQASAAQVAQLTASVAAINIKEFSESMQLRLTKDKEAMDSLKQQVELDKARVSSSKELTSELSRSGLELVQQTESRAMDLNFAIQQYDLTGKIALAEKAASIEKSAGQRNKIKEEIKLFELEKDRLKNNQNIERANKQLLNAKDIITRDAKISNQIETDNYTIKIRSFDIQSQLLDSAQKDLELKKSSGFLLESDYIKQKSSLEIAQSRLATDKEISAAKNTQTLALNDQAAAEARLAEDKKARQARDKADIVKTGVTGSAAQIVETTQQESDAQKVITEARDRINATYDTTAQKANSVLATSLAVTEATKQNALYQEQWNKLLQNTQGIAEALAVAFDGVGKALGDVANNMAQLAKNQADNTRGIDVYNNKITEAEKLATNFYAAGQDAEGDKALRTQSDAIKAKDELQKKSQKDELMGYSKIAGAAKQMFGQKTAAYKVLAATEKAMSIARLAMDAAEIASSFGKMAATVTTTGTNIAAYMAEAGSKGLSAITGAFNLPPPAGFVAGAAMAAIIGGLLGKVFGGKGGSSGPPPVSAADRQSAQGSAMGYDSSSQKVRVREGVLGDTEAKSESIANSLEIISSNSVDGLQYDNKMLRGLEKLNTAFDAVAKQLYGTAGLTGGSAFGTREGSSSSRGFLGLFGGGSSSTEIIDSGIKLEGTFASLTKAGAGVVSSFETVQRTSSSKGFFGIGAKSSTSVNTQFRNLPPATVEAIRGAFSAGEELLREVAKDAGVGYGKVTSILQTLDVKELVSLRGLKGKELAEALNTTMSAILDDASGQIFDTFKQFQDFGEGMLQTAVRVTDSNKKINQALDNINTTDAKFPKLGFAATEALDKLFGGVDKAITAFQNYESKMLTEDERMEKKRVRLQVGLTKLGLQDLNTKEAWNKKTQELIRSGQTNTETFRQLIDLTPDFADAVDAAASKVKTAFDDLRSMRDNLKDILKSLTDFKDSLNKTIMTPGEQYVKAKTDFDTLTAKARAGDVKALRDLPNAGNVFAEASRTMFASSDAYVADIKKITSVVDDLNLDINSKITAADKALEIAVAQDDKLAEIVDNTNLTQAKIQALLDAMRIKDAPVKAATSQGMATVAAELAQSAEPTAAQAAVQAATPAAPPQEIAPVYEILYRQVDAGGDSSNPVLEAYYAPARTPDEIAAEASAQELNVWERMFPNLTHSGGLAKGTNYVAKDMISLIHAGERIMPEADNRQLMQFLDTNNSNGGLYEEIRRLNAQVEQLTKVVADGAIMNAQATDRNTQELSDTMQQTTDQAVYAQRLQSRTSIV